jgi:hypothetical protein
MATVLWLKAVVQPSDITAMILKTFAVLDRWMCLLGEDTNDPTRGKLVVVFMEAKEVEGNMSLEVLRSMGQIRHYQSHYNGQHAPQAMCPGKTLSHRGIRVTCMATGGAMCMTNGPMCKASSI